MLRIKKGLFNKIIINVLLIIIPVAYYSLKFISLSPIQSYAFVNSAYGSSFFPGSFQGFYMVMLSHIGISLYYTYLSFAIVSLYLSLVGSYVFLKNIVALIEGRMNTQGHSSDSVIFSIVILFPSILLSTNPFFANNYDLGVGALPFLMLSMATASEAIKFRIVDKRAVSLIFLTGFLLIFAYDGYILLPPFFAILFAAIIIPLSYRIVPLVRSFAVMLVSEVLFFVFSNAGGFLTGSISGSLGGLFPYFRPLNLEHEYALLSTTGLFKAITGLSFNESFPPATLQWIELLTMILIGIIFSAYLWIEPRRVKIKISYQLIVLFIVIILSLPYSGDIPIIGMLPLYLISNHIVTYNHFGEILSLFDVNRFLLFLYWFLISATLAFTLYFLVIFEKENDTIRNSHSPVLIKRNKIDFMLIVAVACIIILLLASFSASNGPYNYLDMEKNSPTYSYAIEHNSSYNRMLFYQNVNEFYPGNFYPSYMEMQADIPDKPVYFNFLNMESSPIVVPMLNTLPPAAFVYSNGTEGFLHGQSLTNGYKEIENSNANVTVGYPVFVIGSQYTYDQYVFHNYYNRANTTLLNSKTNLVENYGPFSYYSIPAYYIKALESEGGIIEINMGIHIISPIQNGTGYTFGFSNQSQYYPQGNNQLPIGIGVFNRSTSPVLLGTGSPIINDLNNSEYLSIGNAFSYDIENYIPFLGNNTGNISIVFYNSGANGIYGFIDYGGQWYQSASNVSLSQIKYFYSQAYLDSPSGISYNATISNLIKNKNYVNLIPIYYDSPLENDTVLVNSIRYSDQILEGKNYPLSDIVGSFLVNSANSTLINPSAYSIQKQQDGWYQVFTDGAAQSSFTSEYIPSVLDPPIFGYNAYTGFAQSIVENSTFTVPIGGTHSGDEYLDMNLLFSPAGGNLNVNAGNSQYSIDTRSNSSYYKWVGLNISGNIGNLKIKDVAGIQSINQIVLTNVSTYQYFYCLSSSLIRNESFAPLSSLPYINIISTLYRTNPVIYTADIALERHINGSMIIEYSNPTYSGFLESSTNSDSFLLPTWASFPAVLVHNMNRNFIQTIFSESKSAYYSGYLPYVEIQGIWFPFLISFILRKRSKKLITRRRN
jgi:hypothetical protein